MCVCVCVFRRRQPGANGWGQRPRAPANQSEDGIQVQPEPACGDGRWLVIGWEITCVNRSSGISRNVFSLLFVFVCIFHMSLSQPNDNNGSEMGLALETGGGFEFVYTWIDKYLINPYFIPILRIENTQAFYQLQSSSTSWILPYFVHVRQQSCDPKCPPQLLLWGIVPSRQAKPTLTTLKGCTQARSRVFFTLDPKSFNASYRLSLSMYFVGLWSQRWRDSLRHPAFSRSLSLSRACSLSAKDTGSSGKWKELVVRFCVCLSIWEWVCLCMRGCVCVWALNLKLYCAKQFLPLWLIKCVFWYNSLLDIITLIYPGILSISLGSSQLICCFVESCCLLFTVRLTFSIPLVLLRNALFISPVLIPAHHT